MPIEIKMPALSPTMEEGTLAKWLVKEGDTVKAGDIMAEIETDKATMEFEAVDEGTIGKVVVAEGTDGVKVGAVIALLNAEGEEGESTPEPAAKESEAKPSPKDPNKTGTEAKPAGENVEDHGKPADAAVAKEEKPAAPAPAPRHDGDRVKASPLARRIAAAKGVDLAGVQGSGPNGRIVKADIEGAEPGAAPAAAPSEAAAATPAAAPAKPAAVPDIPHQLTKLSNMRKTIARRLTESKQQVPHIYLTVDIQLDKLLKLRGELNAGLEARKVKLSVNDLLIKALGVALMQVPECNVQFAGDQMLQFQRADISVAVSIPGGLITPIVTDAAGRGVASISTAMKDLATRAKDGKLKPEEYQGGTASLSNMGMFGIKQFEAVINPPQAMIMAIGAGEKRPYIVEDAVQIATVMSATGSFDHRAIDGADGARLMQAFKQLVENPIGLLA
jgi:pyruvate dehydrogenase E2 component (dihydrolipoamide acetyltransferase)